MRQTKGFTIVELLIVIVVIAILAAISVVAYTGMQDRAKTTAIQSDLQQLYKKLAYYNIVNDKYPAVSSAELTDADLHFSKSSYDTSMNNVYYCRDNTSNNYSLVSRSKPGTMYMISSTSGGVKSYSGSWAGSSACVASGFSDYAVTAAYVNGGWSSWAN